MNRPHFSDGKTEVPRGKWPPLLPTPRSLTSEPEPGSSASLPQPTQRPSALGGGPGAPHSSQPLVRAAGMVQRAPLDKWGNRGKKPYNGEVKSMGH